MQGRVLSVSFVLMGVLGATPISEGQHRGPKRIKRKGPRSQSRDVVEVGT